MEQQGLLTTDEERVEREPGRITGVRQEKSFRGSRLGGMTHLVVDTADPAEIGFFVTDLSVLAAGSRPRNPN